MARIVFEDVRPGALTPEQGQALWDIHRQYVERTRASFEAGLARSDDIVLCREGAGGPIRGFSVFNVVDVRVGGRNHVVILSRWGFLDRAFRNRSVMQRTGIRAWLRQKRRRPFDPIYCAFTASTVNSYLYLVRSFAEPWPSRTGPTPPLYTELLDKTMTALGEKGWDRPRAGSSATARCATSRASSGRTSCGSTTPTSGSTRRRTRARTAATRWPASRPRPSPRCWPTAGGRCAGACSGSGSARDRPARRAPSHHRPDGARGARLRRLGGGRELVARPGHRAARRRRAGRLQRDHHAGHVRRRRAPLRRLRRPLRRVVAWLVPAALGACLHLAVHFANGTPEVLATIAPSVLLGRRFHRHLRAGPRARSVRRVEVGGGVDGEG